MKVFSPSASFGRLAFGRLAFGRLAVHYIYLKHIITFS
jgi:hypothetical protein